MPILHKERGLIWRSRESVLTRLIGLTVDELSVKLRHQVIKKTDQDHCHDWMYFDVTDEEGGEKLFRHCQSCQKWQAFEAE